MNTFKQSKPKKKSVPISINSNPVPSSFLFNNKKSKIATNYKNLGDQIHINEKLKQFSQKPKIQSNILNIHSIFNINNSQFPKNTSSNRYKNISNVLFTTNKNPPKEQYNDQTKLKVTKHITRQQSKTFKHNNKTYNTIITGSNPNSVRNRSINHTKHRSISNTKTFKKTIHTNTIENTKNDIRYDNMMKLLSLPYNSCKNKNMLTTTYSTFNTSNTNSNKTIKVDVNKKRGFSYENISIKETKSISHHRNTNSINNINRHALNKFIINNNNEKKQIQNIKKNNSSQNKDNNVPTQHQIKINLNPLFQDINVLTHVYVNRKQKSQKQDYGCRNSNNNIYDIEKQSLNVNGNLFENENIIYDDTPYKEDAFDNLNDVVRVIKFNNVNIAQVNVFSVENNVKYDNYQNYFDSEFEKKVKMKRMNGINVNTTAHKAMSMGSKSSERKSYHNVSMSTQDNSNKKYLSSPVHKINYSSKPKQFPKKSSNNLKPTFTSTVHKTIHHKRINSQSASKVSQSKPGVTINQNCITAPGSSISSPKNISSFPHQHEQPLNNNMKSSLEQSTSERISNYNMFLQTINIISEIQEQFEHSVKENKKPLEEIKRLIDNNLNIDNYIALSENQKDNITTDISLSSDLRIQNYKTAFNYIFTSLDDIENGLEKLLPQDNDNDNHKDENENDEIIQNDNYYSSEDELEEEENEDENNKEGNNEGKYHTYRGEAIKQTKLDDADFSEGDMLENAFVLPPKNSPFNYQYVKDMARMRSKKFSVLTHDKKKHKKSDKGVNKKNDNEEEKTISDKENVMKQFEEIKHNTQSNMENNNEKKKEADMDCNMF